ncbi:hypothetical protein M2161_008962 [Streptomyces sp. SAI-133]|nr:hypothetical protein [Streptomyces sp. SAI-133]
MFPDDTSCADLAQALEPISEQMAQGFTPFCIKPSQFTDDPNSVGAFCREVMHRVELQRRDHAETSAADRRHHWEGHAELLTTLREELVGKVVIDCLNPLGFAEWGSTSLSPGRTAPASRRPPCRAPK